MNSATLARGLDEALQREADPERAANEKRYLKSPLRHYGVKVPAIRNLVKTLLKNQPSLTREGFGLLVRQLWSGDVHEKRMAAVLLLDARTKDLEAADFGLIEEMIRGSFTWAYVDVLAAGVAGGLVERYPELTNELDRWSQDESFWLRRSSMLALLGPLRRGEGDWQRFQRYADKMLGDREFFIGKAIVWALRETSKKRPELVRQYVAARLDRLSGLTFREAVKHLPAPGRDELSRAYQAVRKS